MMRKKFPSVRKTCKIQKLTWSIRKSASKSVNLTLWMLLDMILDVNVSLPRLKAKLNPRKLSLNLLVSTIIQLWFHINEIMSVIKVGFVDCHLLCTVIKVWVNYAITKTLSSEIMLVIVKLRTCLFSWGILNFKWDWNLPIVLPFLEKSKEEHFNSLLWLAATCSAKIWNSLEHYRLQI